MSLTDLVAYVNKKGHGRFVDPQATAKLLQKAARDSFRLVLLAFVQKRVYRPAPAQVSPCPLGRAAKGSLPLKREGLAGVLDKCLSEPLTISIASSFNCISAFEKERDIINKAIERAIKGLYANEYLCLTSIPGIGPVYAAGILAEIGNIADFNSDSAIAKYAGLTWKQNQSGDFAADTTRMSKQGNSYLRYYLIEAANSVKNHNANYNAFYRKKFDEATTHHHKRALALTARKLVRLIFGFQYICFANTASPPAFLRVHTGQKSVILGQEARS